MFAPRSYEMQANESKTDSKVIRKYTAEELRNEFNYLGTRQITGMMLSRELITPDEYRRIMAENMVSFPTFISQIH